jgi:DNA-binding MarR family transcriptional regulator
MTRSRPSTARPPSGATALVDALVQTAFTTMAVLNKVAAESDLSLTQLRVLAILRDRRAGVTALAEHLGLEKSTMSGLVERAEKRGLLERTPSESDRRGVQVSITPEGMKLADRMYAHVERSLLPQINALGPADRTCLRGLLERMLRTGDDETTGATRPRRRVEKTRPPPSRRSLLRLR